MNRMLLALMLLCTSLLARAADEGLLGAPPFNSNALLPAPPAEGSATTHAELAELEKIQAQRTPAELARAKADAAQENVFAFSNVLGASFTAEQFPLTTQFFDRVTAVEKIAVRDAKSFWHRRRRPGR